MHIVTVFFQNNNNEILVQKRSKEKNGKYGITSGHIEKNEEVKIGAIREIKEELGIDIEEKDLKLFFNTKINENEYNLYYIKKDIEINRFLLQKEEVESVKWCNQHEIEGLIERNEFFETQIEALNIFKKYTEEKIK